MAPRRSARQRSAPVLFVPDSRRAPQAHSSSSSHSQQHLDSDASLAQQLALEEAITQQDEYECDSITHAPIPDGHALPTPATVSERVVSPDAHQSSPLPCFLACRQILGRVPIKPRPTPQSSSLLEQSTKSSSSRKRRRPSIQDQQPKPPVSSLSDCPKSIFARRVTDYRIVGGVKTHNALISAFDVCRDRPLVCSGDKKGGLWLHNFQSGVSVEVPCWHSSYVSYVGWSQSDTGTLFSASYDCRLFSYDVRSQQRTTILQRPEKNEPVSFALPKRSANDVLYVGDNSGCLLVVDPRCAKRIVTETQTLHEKKKILHVDRSPNGRVIATSFVSNKNH